MNFMPMWVAPNLVTTIGVVWLLSSWLIGNYSCPSVNCQFPTWYYLLCAWNIFIYQLLDNLDGKQARRTNTSSPLGELFDHGCDSLFLLLVSVGMKSALDLNEWEAFNLFACGVLVFYASHWEEYHTHNLIMGKYANPTEAQCGMILLLLISAISGPSFWSRPVFTIPYFNFPFLFKYFVVLATFVGCFATLAENGYKTLVWAGNNSKSSFYAISPILPMIIHVGSMYIWVLTSPSNVLQNQFLLVVILMAVVFSALCDWLVICRITKMEFVVPNPVLLFSITGALVSVSKLPDHFVLLGLCGTLSLVYVYFLVCIVLQFKHHLDINVFTIKAK